jgi:hypothetical protein
VRHPRTRLALVALVLVVAAPAACSDDGGGSAEELCRVVGDGRAFTDVFATGFDPTDVERATAQLEAAETDLGELRAAAPSEVRDDLDAESDYLDAVAQVLADGDPDDPAAIVASINALAEQRSKAQVAGLELRNFEAQHCGGSAASSTTVPGTTTTAG